MWLRSKNSYTDKEILTIIKALIDYYNNLLPFSDIETDVENLILKLCKEINISDCVTKINYMIYLKKLSDVADTVSNIKI